MTQQCRLQNPPEWGISGGLPVVTEKRKGWNRLCFSFERLDQWGHLDLPEDSYKVWRYLRKSGHFINLLSSQWRERCAVSNRIQWFGHSWVFDHANRRHQMGYAPTEVSISELLSSESILEGEYILSCMVLALDKDLWRTLRWSPNSSRLSSLGLSSSFATKKGDYVFKYFSVKPYCWDKSCLCG